MEKERGNLYRTCISTLFQEKSRTTLTLRFLQMILSMLKRLLKNLKKNVQRRKREKDNFLLSFFILKIRTYDRIMELRRLWRLFLIIEIFLMKNSILISQLDVV